MATAKVDFTPLDDAPSATFELNNALKISKVVDAGGQTLNTTRNGKDLAVNVTFPSPLPKNKPAEISFTYEGQFSGSARLPVYGISFAALKPDFGFLLYPSRWFPVSGYTVDRFTADLHITAPSDYKVIASGDSKVEKLSGNRNVYTFAYTQNASFPGSVALVKGEPQRVSSQGITTSVYFRQHTAEAHNYGEESGKVMTFLTSQYGLAPQANLTLIETEAGAPNGYAAPGIVFFHLPRSAHK